MGAAHVRITGRPKIERDHNGLRKITRTYVVQGDQVTEPTLEAQVFLPFGTADAEYDATITQDLSKGGTETYPLTGIETTGAYLVAQELAPGKSINEAILTRVYQELQSTPTPVQVGKDEITLNANDRIHVKRTYIVKNPYADHYAEGRVGVVTITVEGKSCPLGTVVSKDTGVYTEFIEGYFEAGVLSESIDYKYGQGPEHHKLEIRTVRGITAPKASELTGGPGSGPWVEFETREGPGNADYGQAGRTIYTGLFAKGEGLIEESSTVKGKPPNTVALTTVRYITGDNGEVPKDAVPNFTRRTFEGMVEKDGWELHTIKGIVVENKGGVVDADVTYHHGTFPSHKLEIIKATAYGQAPTAASVTAFLPSGNSNLGGLVLIAEGEDHKGEWDLFTATFARGKGVVSKTTRDKAGVATVTETVTLQAAGTTTDLTLAEGELTKKVDQRDGYELLTVTATTGEGTVSQSRRKTGLKEITETVRRQDSGTTTDLALGDTDIAKKVDQRDGYELYTLTETTIPEATIISSGLTYRTGINLVDIKSYTAFGTTADAAAAGGGIAADWQTVASSAALDSQGETVYSVTYAAVNDDLSYIRFDTRSLQVPGTFLIDLNGVTKIPPVSRPVAVKIATSYSKLPIVAPPALHIPPSAAVKWTVTFTDESEPYIFDEAGSNMVWHKNTTTNIKSAPNQLFSEFQGKPIESSEYSTTGNGVLDRPGVGAVLDYESKPLTIAGSFVCYQNSEITLNEAV